MELETPDELKGKSLLSEEAMQELADQAQDLDMGYQRAEVKEFTGHKNVDFPQEQELFERILNLVYEYDDEISIAASIGILDLAKDQITNGVR